MELLKKILDYVLSKSFFISIISFIFSVVVIMCVPVSIYDLLPFDNKINIIIIFVSIFLLIYLILYGLIKIIMGICNKSKEKSTYNKEIEVQNKDLIEAYRSFFDKISNEEYSIIMYFIKYQNQKVYKEWSYRGYSSNNESIFSTPIVHELFYYSESNEHPPLESSKDFNGNEVSFRAIGPCKNYKLKPKYYNLFKYIFDKYGTLSHFERELVELKYGNKVD